ncbi:MAG: hypothetical protein ACYDCK_00065 [Thermoplasmatota archaeon]
MRFALLALLVAFVPATALAVDAGGASTASRCTAVATGAASVPCGYIYPVITIAAENASRARSLSSGETLELPAKLTFTFDMINEGFTAPDPQNPIVVSFEYPRKPDWAAMSVEPPQIPIPIEPQYVQLDPSDPNNLQGHYVYTTAIKVIVSEKGVPVLPDGRSTADLIVFAKSTESGLYKSGYGIKELHVAPTSFITESAARGNAKPPVIIDAGTPRLGAIERVARGFTAKLEPPQGALEFWKPLPFTLDVAPRASGATVTALLALVGPDGAPLESSGPRTVDSNGKIAFNLTLVEAARTTLVAFVTASDASFAPQAIAFPLDLSTDAPSDQIRYGKEMRIVETETVSAIGARADTANPLLQYERDFPFQVLPLASGAVVTLGLIPPAGSPVTTGPANLNVQMLDPTGAVVLQGTVDAANPQRTFEAGALPGAGQYALRVFGTGLPSAANYRFDLDVQYDENAIGPRVGDLARAPATLPLGTFNATFDATNASRGASLWTPMQLALTFKGAPGALASALTVVDAEGTTLAATGEADDATKAEASFTPPAPGTDLAIFYVAPPAMPPRVFEPFLIVQPLDIEPNASGAIALPARYEIRAAGAIPATPADGSAVLAEFRVPAMAADVTLASSEVAGGVTVTIEKPQCGASGAIPCWANARVSGSAPPAGGTYAAKITASYASAPTLNLAPAAGDGGRNRLPTVSPVMLLAILGLAALSIAARRR